MAFRLTHDTDRAPAITRLTLRADGSAEIAVGGHEMGQGLWTAVALAMSNRLSIDPAAIRVIAGDRASVPQHLTAGSWGTATVVPSVEAAAEKMHALIAEREGRGGLTAGLSRLFAGNGGRPLEVTVESLAPDRANQPWTGCARGCRLPPDPTIPKRWRCPSPPISWKWPSIRAPGSCRWCAPIPCSTADWSS
ncbi:molybdopterin cofactor-binding domain-containing protein [Tistrella mobilis]